MWSMINILKYDGYDDFNTKQVINKYTNSLKFYNL